MSRSQPRGPPAGRGGWRRCGSDRVVRHLVVHPGGSDRPLHRLTRCQTGWLWPTERSSRLSEVALSDRFSRYRDELALPVELSLRSLRQSHGAASFRCSLICAKVRRDSGLGWGGSRARPAAHGGTRCEVALDHATFDQLRVAASCQVRARLRKTLSSTSCRFTSARRNERLARATYHQGQSLLTRYNSFCIARDNGRNRG